MSPIWIVKEKRVIEAPETLLWGIFDPGGIRSRSDRAQFTFLGADNVARSPTLGPVSSAPAIPGSHMKPAPRRPGDLEAGTRSVNGVALQSIFTEDPGTSFVVLRINGKMVKTRSLQRSAG
jgi:hypothetical protein